MGQNTLELTVVDDAELPEFDLENHHLLCYGTPETNAVLKKFSDRLPLSFDDKTVRLSDRTYSGDRVSAFAAFPHPLNADRMVAVHGGVTPDAVCWGTHLDMQLLPDYLVYDGGNLLDWGFWGNDWKSQTTASRDTP